MVCDVKFQPAFHEMINSNMVINLQSDYSTTCVLTQPSTDTDSVL